MVSSTNHDYISHCLQLAQQGRGHTGVNPLVGACLVRDDTIIGEGYHTAFGAPHAEAELIKNFDQEIRLQDRLYVNLEPCFHHGKTGPCSQAIIDAGIKTVVVGMVDPNPQVAGQGIAALQQAGVEVIGPIDSTVCKRFNRGFVSVMEKQRPWITLKQAQTIDGQTAHLDGSPLKITSPEQDTWSHTQLRATHDAILVGVGTVLSDDPQLTLRLLNKNCDQNIPQPYRIILDPHLKISLEAQVVSDDHCYRTIVVTSGDSDQGKQTELADRGVWVVPIDYDGHHFALDQLWQTLITPKDDFIGISSVLVEGGAKTWSAFWEAGVVDEEVVLVN